MMKDCCGANTKLSKTAVSHTDISRVLNFVAISPASAVSVECSSTCPSILEVTLLQITVSVRSLMYC